MGNIRKQEKKTREIATGKVFCYKKVLTSLAFLATLTAYLSANNKYYHNVFRQ